jgi:hypothetical protein
VTEVAWSALAHPVADAAAADVPEDEDADEDAPEDAGAEDAACAADVADDAPDPAGAEAVTEPHPASAEHNRTASTVPRTWRGDIMVL